MCLLVFVVCHDFSPLLERSLATALRMKSWLEFISYWSELVGFGSEFLVRMEQVFLEALRLKLLGTLGAF